VLHIIVPTLVETMHSESAATRAGVCVALREILEAMTHDQLPAVMPAVQAALCDPDAAVREAAGDAFAVLFRGGAGSLVEGMLPALLEGLKEEEKAGQSIKGIEVRGCWLVVYLLAWNRICVSSNLSSALHPIALLKY
jgi:HEAT repeat